MEPTLEQLKEWWEHKPASQVSPKVKFGIVSVMPFEATRRSNCIRGRGGDLCLHRNTPANIYLLGHVIHTTTWAGSMHADCAVRTASEMIRYDGPLMTPDELDDYREGVLETAASPTAPPQVTLPQQPIVINVDEEGLPTIDGAGIELITPDGETERDFIGLVKRFPRQPLIVTTVPIESSTARRRRFYVWKVVE